MEFMFLLYSLIIFVSINGIGKLIIKPSSKFYRLRLIIGFACLLCVLQLGYYPMQIFQAPSAIVFVYTLIVMLFSFAYGIKVLKKEDFSFLKSWEFYFLLILIFVVIRILPSTDAGDDWFYMPLIQDNIDTSRINSIQPRSGWDWNVNELWKFQGYYLFVSFFAKIQSVFFQNVSNILISFKSTFTLVMILLASINISYISDINDKKDKGITILIKVGCILLVSFLDWSHIYWGSFSVYVTLYPLLLVLLNYYCKKPDRKIAILIAIVNAAILSMFSSGLFLNILVLFSFYFYQAWKKKIVFNDFLIMILSNVIYLCFFLGYWYLSFIIVILYFVLLRNENKIGNRILNSYSLYLCIALPVCIIILSFLLSLNITWSLYRLSSLFLVFNIGVSLAIGYACFIKKMEVQPILLAFVFFNLCFFNPLVSSFISKFITTDMIYYRLFYITKNPIVLAYIFYFIADLVGKRQLSNILFRLSMSLICVYYALTMIRGSNAILGFDKNYHYLLREPSDTLKVAQFLSEHNEYDGAFIWSIYYAPRQYDSQYKTKVSRYPQEEKDDIMVKGLDNNTKLSQQDFISFKNAAFKDGVSLCISFNKEEVKERMKYLSKIVYENDTFVVYEMTIK